MALFVMTGAGLAAGGSAVAQEHAGSHHAKMDHAAMTPDAAQLVVYKTANCGCCGNWAEHMKSAGFDVKVHQVSDEELSAIKQAKGVTRDLASCHTAEIGGYTVEGHVPASDLKTLLSERPEGIVGIAVPGMPMGSPGMENPDQPADSYDVLTFTASGETAVFVSH
ncbi:MAG: DUF411 domain-containing protein [Gemmatimonadota bacterium]|nr:DUF411 domain-containing protein [Gemmatimonadota bacterium]